MMVTKRQYSKTQLCTPDIDRAAVVHCPMYNFVLCRAQACVGCEHYLGCIDLGVGNAETWAARYRVVCKYPTARRCDTLMPCTLPPPGGE